MKLPPPPPEIFTVIDAGDVKVPDFPVTLMVANPVAVALAVIVSVSPLTATVTAGFELMALRVTTPVKPPMSVTVMASVTLEPGASVSLAEAGVSVKLPPPVDASGG